MLATREFVLVVDPFSLDALYQHPLNLAVGVISELARLDPPLRIRLLFPVFLATEQHSVFAATGRIPLDMIHDEVAVPELRLSRDLHRRIRERIERGAEGDSRGLRLLALADHAHADGVVTAIPSIVDARYELLRHHKFRVVEPRELPDFVEVSARGHSISCSAGSFPRWPPPDLLYQATHWKARRLWEWFNHTVGSISDAALAEHLRSALLNRYPMILHARDMVRFFELQKDHHFRRGAKQPVVFRAFLNYHLTAFYVHAWGMLDALANIANRRLSLRVHPRRCGILSDEFLDRVRDTSPGLWRFIGRHRAPWIAILGDVRHPVAHSAMRLQHDIVTATDESKKIRLVSQKCHGSGRPAQQ